MRKYHVSIVVRDLPAVLSDVNAYLTIIGQRGDTGRHGISKKNLTSSSMAALGNVGLHFLLNMISHFNSKAIILLLLDI